MNKQNHTIDSVYTRMTPLAEQSFTADAHRKPTTVCAYRR